jgi:predicted nucleic acid-binding protein
MPDRLVISNTSPLLYLHQVGHLELLPRLYGQIQIPSAVREELRAGAELGVAVPDIGALEWLQVEPLRDTALLPVVIDLGPGEAEAIALAIAHPGSLKAKNQGLLPSVSPVIEALRSTTMYLTESLIETVLREAGEV